MSPWYVQVLPYTHMPTQPPTLSPTHLGACTRKHTHNHTHQCIPIPTHPTAHTEWTHSISSKIKCCRTYMMTLRGRTMTQRPLRWHSESLSSRQMPTIWEAEPSVDGKSDRYDVNKSHPVCPWSCTVNIFLQTKQTCTYTCTSARAHSWRW